MASVLLFFVTVIISYAGGAPTHCCNEKTVGGVAYTLKKEGNTSSYDCLDDCMFEKVGEPGPLFCFQEGYMEVVCDDPKGCKCGVKKESRIIGGSDSEVDEYPWMALMLRVHPGIMHIHPGYRTIQCGGTLVAEQWVVTAANCLFDNLKKRSLNEDEILLILGLHSIRGPQLSTLPINEFKVSKIIVHPEFVPVFNQSNNPDSPLAIHDIALLKLANPADLTVYTPACLPNTGDDFTNETAWTYGWGTSGFISPDNITNITIPLFPLVPYLDNMTMPVVPEKLQELEVSIVSDSVCQAAWMHPGVEITPGMVCTGAKPHGPKGNCIGDSGSPLTVEKNGQHTLVGDASFGPTQCGEGHLHLYNVYTENAMYRHWIDDNMAANGGATYCPA